MANGLFGGGDGNPATPFLVEDGADLNAVRNNLGKAYKQVANVDLVAYANWVPIGTNTVGSQFTGIFDGGGFSVSNLNINVTHSYVGLFGYVSGQILGINILSGSIATTGVSVGAITGHSSSNITFCSNQGCDITKTGGSVTTQAAVGGIAGSGNVYDSFNTANISSTGGRTGGITGQSSAVRCYNTGNVTTSGNQVFGISNTSATNCYNSGAVTCTYESSSDVHGVCMGTATDSYNIGALTSAGPFGVIYGVCAGAATRCYNTANLSCGNPAFGVSGTNATDCFNTGSLTSTAQSVYGICGSTATRCYNTGNIRAFAGGYGITVSAAYNCYALFDTITRISGSTATTTWAKVSKVTSSTTNYALDTMTLIYE